MASTRGERVSVEMTRKQAEFLFMLLSGFIDRETGMSKQIIRKTNQIGKRVADAIDAPWRKSA